MAALEAPVPDTPASERLPRIRVAALILLDGKVVLARHLKDGRRYHLLPGGGVHFGESLEDALVREVTEETGLRVCLGRLLFVSDTLDPDGRRHVVNVVFAAEIAGGAIVASPRDPRVEAVDLVEPSQLAHVDLRPPIAQPLLDALRDPDHAPMRYLGPLFVEDKQA